jgi:hypothetical protein
MPKIDLDRMIEGFYSSPSIREREFFYHAQDRMLLRFTGGAFPAKVKTTHPVLVLDVTPSGLSVCPCTRGPKTPQRYRYIAPAAIKRTPISVPEATTYLIEDKSFPAPDDPFFWRDLTPHGQVPEEAIEGRFRPEVTP